MSKDKKHSSQAPLIRNRQATFQYELLDKYVAGIVLRGTEVKSIRRAHVSLQEAYCYLLRGELWIKNMPIAPYEQGNIYNHEENRPRKLLLTRKELNRLAKSQEKGLTIIPIELFFDQKNRAKLQIALAKGKKLYDKRQAIKERDIKRELSRRQAED
jgi:SsrA-binding protein